MPLSVIIVTVITFPFKPDVETLFDTSLMHTPR